MMEEQLLTQCQDRELICMAEDSSLISSVLLGINLSSKLQMLPDLWYPNLLDIGNSYCCYRYKSTINDGW